ncbi:sulfurtransferase [Calidifontibacter terrae]
MTTTRPLISVDRLAELLDGDNPPAVLDVRWQLNAPSQRPAYDEGHLPGAAWVEFEVALSAAPGDGGRHPMPNAATFQQAMRAAGVNEDHGVVVYDAANSLAASRCWWLLRYFGHDRVAVLDGGLDAWVRSGRKLSSAPVSPAAGDFVATPDCRPLLDADAAADLAYRSVLLDARPAERFAGRNETIDPVAGHIPGAHSMPALANVDELGHFLPADDLAMRFTAAGVQAEEEVGVYCGSGVQASHLALALEHSGIHSMPGVYIGSWSHWITDPERPVETD